MYMTVSVFCPLAVSAEEEREEEGFMISRKEALFRPLIADPRWPHFSISYQYYFDDDELKNVGATSFGETLPFYRSRAFGGQWQIGIQAAVFAIFDLDSESMDLINADYWVGIPLSYKKENFSSLLRLFHQSSHLGDEFLLRSRVDRINLSYEVLDFKVSYDLREWIRLYSGIGHLIRREPADLDPWSVQYGLELRSPSAYGVFRPVAGADFKNREESGWNTDMMLSLGIFIESEKTVWNKLHIMIEYFNGRSPHGQFYERYIEFLSIGTGFYFQ